MGCFISFTCEETGPQFSNLLPCSVCGRAGDTQVSRSCSGAGHRSDTRAAQGRKRERSLYRWPTPGKLEMLFLRLNVHSSPQGQFISLARRGRIPPQGSWLSCCRSSCHSLALSPPSSAVPSVPKMCTGSTGSTIPCL